MDDLEARVRHAPDEMAPAFALCAAYIRGRDIRANVLLDDLLLRFPLAVDGWDHMGKALLDVAERGAALVCFLRALHAEPNARRAVVCGMMLRESGCLDEARDAFRTGVGTTSETSHAWVGLGLCEQDLGRLPEAAEAYRQATVCQPEMAEAHVRLGKVLQSMGNLSGAKAAYGRAVALRADTLKRVAKALTAERTGELWLDLGRLRHDLKA